MARIDRDVWFFLVEARVTSDSERGLPGDFFRRPLEAAASRNQCVLGIFVTADGVSSTREDVH